MTIFEIKDERLGDEKFTVVTRAYYKKVITIHDRAGQPFRVGTEYRDGTPVKLLTLRRPYN
ncbi:hypothetical protein LCGC14_1770850 [marine sediment metagenome]|uniref:Uncharacterized protein n=1 Tax=marine sediment metagenome TaxID=412755 RepID=A0A0F9GYC7_9ZZZZ